MSRLISCLFSTSIFESKYKQGISLALYAKPQSSFRKFVQTYGAKLMSIYKTFQVEFPMKSEKYVVKPSIGIGIWDP